MSSPLPAGMMRTRGGVRIAIRPGSTGNVAASLMAPDDSVTVVLMGIEFEMNTDESHQLRDLLHDAELRAARGDVIA